MRVISFQAYSRPTETGRMTHAKRRRESHQDPSSGHGCVYLQPEFESTSDAVVNTKLK